MMKLHSIKGLFLISLLSTGCVLAPESYNSKVDQGTYRGTAIAYDGEGNSPNFRDRVCPNIDLVVTVDESSIVFDATDIYPNYVPDAGVITSHTGMATSYGNNKFKIDLQWAYLDTFDSVQLNDLMNLNICDSTAPSNPTNNYTGDKGRLGNLGLTVSDEFGHQGEFGQGKMQGSLFYGVECTDGELIPLCVYFMQLKKD